MSKLKTLAALTAALTLTTGAAFADGHGKEKCMVNKDGKGLILERKADCAGANHSCAGQNTANDTESWILVPEGHCAKINAGDIEGVDQKILDKIDLDALLK